MSCLRQSDRHNVRNGSGTGRDQSFNRIGVMWYATQLSQVTTAGWDYAPFRGSWRRVR